MCLAIPAQIVSINGATAEVDIVGNRITADLSVLPDAAVGEYVLVHAGMAIQRYDEEEALATLDLIREIAAKAVDA
jgi:hydrogenase expression/formation protein HypC